MVVSKWCIEAVAMDSIDWSEIHHFKTAFYRQLFKGMKQKKTYTCPTIGLQMKKVMFLYDVALLSRAED
jgi:hypothetical protein